MIYKIANTQEEYEQIFKLNYETFVDEIPQHKKNETKKLKDKFHDKNSDKTIHYNQYERALPLLNGIIWDS